MTEWIYLTPQNIPSDILDERYLFQWKNAIHDPWIDSPFKLMIVIKSIYLDEIMWRCRINDENIGRFGKFWDHEECVVYDYLKEIKEGCAYPYRALHDTGYEHFEAVNPHGLEALIVFDDV